MALVVATAVAVFHTLGVALAIVCRLVCDVASKRDAGAVRNINKTIFHIAIHDLQMG